MDVMSCPTNIPNEKGVVVQQVQPPPPVLSPSPSMPMPMHTNYVLVDSEDSSSTGEMRPATSKPRVSLCGIDPDTTSSMVHRLYTAGASAVSDPPRKVGKPKQDQHHHHHHHHHEAIPLHSASKPRVRFCGMDPANSSKVVDGLFAAGVATMANPQRLCRRSEPPPQYQQPSSPQFPAAFLAATALSTPQRQKSREKRVLSIVEDLKEVAPELINRKSVARVVKQSEQQKVREKKKKKQEKVKMMRKGRRRRSHQNDKREHEKVEVEATSSDVEGSSGEYPSDIDEFLGYARLVVEEQNTSYDSDSFREFESAMKENLRSHFLDNASDDDSMTSASSFSGYMRDSKRPNMHLEENSLISDSSFHRLKGSIAHKKATPRTVTFAKKKSAKFPVTAAAAAVPNDGDAGSVNEINDLITPLGIISDDEETRDDTVTSGLTWMDAIKVGKSLLKPLHGSLHGEANDEESTLLSEMNVSGFRPISPKSLLKKQSSLGTTAIPANVHYFLSTPGQPHKDIDTSDSDDTVTTGTSLAAIKRRVETGNAHLLERYMIDPEDNSVISETAYKPRPRVRKRRFRKKQAKIIAEDEQFDRDLPNDKENVEQTVDDLAFILTEGNHRNGTLSQDLNSVDRHAVLNQLQTVAPDLYQAVVAKMEINYAADRAEDEGGSKPPRMKRTEGDRVALSRELSPLPNMKETIGGSPSEFAVNLPSIHIACSTPDKVYWADHSREIEDEDDFRAHSGMHGLISREPVGSERPPLIIGSSPMSHSPQQESSLSHLGMTSTLSSTPEIMRSGYCEWESPIDRSFANNVNDVSRGSFWDEALRVDDDEEGEQLDQKEQVSNEMASISVDDIDTSCIFMSHRRKIGSSKRVDENYLDIMIDGFLSEKIDRLNILIRERQIVSARKYLVLSKLKRAQEFLRPTGRSLINLGGDHTPEKTGPATPEGNNTQRGQALIRKIQRKRKALILARQRQRETRPTKTVVLESLARQTPPKLPAEESRQRSFESEASSSPASMKRELPANRSTLLHSIAEIPQKVDRYEEEDKLEDFLTSPMSHASAKSPLEITRSAILRVRARRKKILKAQIRGRQNTSTGQKALHESMDYSDPDSQDTVQTGSTASKFSSPPTQVIKLTFRSKRAEPQRNYEALPEQESSSFERSPDMKSQDILQALEPPSPESPIPHYQLAERASDVSSLNALASGDLSRDDGRVLVFGDDDKSGDSLQVDTADNFRGSFADIVLRSVANNETAKDEEKIFVNIRKKDSPTSIADFFSVYNTPVVKTHNDNLAFVDDEEEDPLFVDDDERFLHKPLGNLLMHEEAGGFVEANFISSTQFEI